MKDDTSSRHAEPAPTSVGEKPGQLRFLTCGPVDDGNSTLIGRLLQISALPEREPRIAGDVAFRCFSTPRRSFIVADALERERNTRDLVTAAARAELVVVLIDVRKGIVAQTRRHCLVCSLLGIAHLVLAVDKIELVERSREAFGRAVEQFRSFASDLGFASVVAIPVSVLCGDNLASRSATTPWYAGPTLLEHLESVDVRDRLIGKPLRLPIESVTRPDAGLCYAGTIASGRLRRGDAVAGYGSGQASRITRIITADRDREVAEASDAVTVTLADELDVGRGDLLAAPDAPPQVADQLAAYVIWMDREPLLPGRPYLMQIGTRTVPASVTSIKHRIDVDTHEHLAARSLGLDELGLCNIATAVPVTFDPHRDNKATGAFMLIDRYSNRTVGAGMVAFGLHRASNVPWQPLAVDKAARAALKKQKPAVLWFTGLPGAGKSTIANLVEDRLCRAGYHTMLLDGDNLRHGLNRDLGFTEADRVENIRRVGEVAKLMVESGLIVLCAFISPYRAERDLVRSLVAEGELIEIFVDTPLDECKGRDPKGLYAKALAGKLKNVTGVDAPYEAPERPELHLCTSSRSPEELAAVVLRCLEDRKIVAEGSL
jgi:bifunctional enzyme CysN/CysC